LTADFVRRFASLGELMHIYTSPPAFDEELRKSSRSASPTSTGEVRFRVGDRVRFAVLPEWAARLDDEARRIVEFCVGRTYIVEDITPEGLLVLDVSGDVD